MDDDVESPDRDSGDMRVPELGVERTTEGLAVLPPPDGLAGRSLEAEGAGFEGGGVARGTAVAPPPPPELPDEEPELEPPRRVACASAADGAANAAVTMTDTKRATDLVMVEVSC